MLRAVVVMWAVGVAVAAGLAGCGDNAPQVRGRSCPGASPPPLAECFTGTLFADCGGTGSEPVLGCAQVDCRWFAGDCVAAGYEASDCPPDDICCKGKGWPYPAGGVPHDNLYLDFYAFGLEPWSRTSDMNLSVAIDPAIQPAALRCSGTDPQGGSASTCFDWDGTATGRFKDTLVFVPTLASEWGLWSFIEIDPTSPRVARFCERPETDFGTPVCPQSQAICAASGRLTLSRMPATDEDLHGLQATLDATFDSGFHVTGGFAIP